jgi:hypothetical protein
MKKVGMLAELMLIAFLLSGCFGGPRVKGPSSVRDAIDIYIKDKIIHDDGVYIIKYVKTDLDYIGHLIHVDKDGYFILGAKFTGGPVNYEINYYVKRTESGYRVIKTLLYKSNGVVLNDLIWMKGAR